MLKLHCLSAWNSNVMNRFHNFAFVLNLCHYTKSWADDADQASRSVAGIPPPTSLDLITDRVNQLFDEKVELDGKAAQRLP